MNFSKSFVVTSALLSLATLSSAAIIQIPAPPPPPPATKVFAVSGVFQDGAVLSGTFDITNGHITSADMTVSGIDGIFTLDRNGGGDYKRPMVWENVDLSDDGNVLSLAFLLKAGSKDLQNYTGGALCDASSNCGQTVSYYLPDCDKDPILSSGNIALAPEPGSTTLLGAGLCAIGLTLRKRFSKK